MTKTHDIHFFAVKIPFVRMFKHGSAERATTETVLVQIFDGDNHVGYGEGCPRFYVTGETIDTARSFFRAHEANLKTIRDFAQLSDYVVQHSREIDLNPAAWSAAEMAFLDLFGKQQNIPVECFWQIPRRRTDYVYSAIIGDCSPNEFRTLYLHYRQLGYTDFKIKLANDPEKDKNKIAVMRDEADLITVRADVNNLWNSTNEALQHLSHINFTFSAIEEPLRSKNIVELQVIAEETGAKIVLDESLLVYEQIERLKINPHYWIVNARSSKYGGIIRSLKIIEELVSQNIEIVVGAHVGESSLLTRASLLLADAAKHTLRAQEGGFSTHLLTQDPFEPPLKIGKSGKLDKKALNCREIPGFGLEPISNLTQLPEVCPLSPGPRT